MDDILENPDKPWVWEYFDLNPNITMKYILDHPDKDWDWKTLSYRLNITLNDVLENPDKPWDWKNLSTNLNIKMNDVTKNPDKPWDWNELSNNPGISLNDILKNINNSWNWSYVSFNTFKFDDRLNNTHLKKLQLMRLRSKFFRSKSCFKLYKILTHPSQKFYKWYCGEGGIGRRIDNERQMRM